jgi:aminoglycoside phosphotransferase family enzyme
MTPKTQIPAIDEKVHFLSWASHYPYPTDAVDVRETHMSWVFLTDRHAYKLKKPIRYDHLDLSTVKAREENCLAEVALNSRLAEEIYLGIVPLSISEEGVMHLEEEGEIVDWLVKMKRIPEEYMLDYQIAHHGVDEELLEKTAERLASFYSNAPRADYSPEAFPERLRSELEDYFQELFSFQEVLHDELMWEIENRQLNFLRDNAPLFGERVRQKKIVEGHGDLRPEHVCLTDPPVIIDCLEFDKELRTLDPVDDLSLLSVECEFKDAPEVGARILKAYFGASGDRLPEPLIFFYKSYRAVIRALLSIRHISEAHYRNDPKWASKANKYLKMASRYTRMFYDAGS